MKYLYGIVNSNALFAIRDEISGKLVYNIPYQKLGAVVSELAEGKGLDRGGDFPSHRRIVKILMKDYTVLPVKTGTILGNDKDVKAMLEKHYKQFGEHLSRLQQRVEMKVKVIWDMERIISNATGRNIETSNLEKEIKEILPLQKLSLKLKKRFLQRYLEVKAEQIVKGIHLLLLTQSDDAHCRKMVTPRILLSGAYLVKKDKVNDFQQAFQIVKSRHSELKYLLSGPSPPYSFITLKK